MQRRTYFSCIKSGWQQFSDALPTLCTSLINHTGRLHNLAPTPAGGRNKLTWRSELFLKSFSVEPFTQGQIYWSKTKMSTFTESSVIGWRWAMILSRSNALRHLLHCCHLISWDTSATLFDLSCIFTDSPMNPQCCSAFKSPKISVTEAPVVLQHLPRATRYFLTEQYHHLVDRKHIPPSYSSLSGNRAHQQRSPRGTRGGTKLCCSWEFGYIGFTASRNNAHTIANYRKPLWSWMHHEEGIPHLTLGPLKPQLGLIKQQRRGASLPRWKLADGTGLLLRGSENHQPAILHSSVSHEADATYSCMSVISTPPPAQMCFLIFEFLQTQLSRSAITNPVLAFPVIPSSAAAIYRRAFRHFKHLYKDLSLLEPHQSCAVWGPEGHTRVFWETKQTSRGKSAKNQDKVHLRETALFYENWEFDWDEVALITHPFVIFFAYRGIMMIMAW